MLNMQKQVRNSGFTLIEMSLALILIGITIGAFLPLLNNYQKTKKLTETRENMTLAQSALRQFVLTERRYPCPADPDLLPDNAEYGREQCNTAAEALANPAVCPAGIVCTNQGSRDADGDTLPDYVMIGVLPSRTLAEATVSTKFTMANRGDGYFMHQTYAVTEKMTHAPTSGVPVSAQLGAIAVRDETDRPLIDPEDSAHYVLISHGDNARGAFSVEGSSVGGCVVNTTPGDPSSPPAPAGNTIGSTGIPLETENCDRDDAIFVSGLRSMADNDGYFDDMLIFDTVVVDSLWRRAPSSPSDAVSYLYNTNLGNVGVGVNEPASKLHVNGNIRAETHIESDGGYCKQGTTTNCLDPRVLAGDMMRRCTGGTAATGIEDSDLVCEPVVFSGSFTFNCPAGTYLTSFTNLGNFTCL